MSLLWPMGLLWTGAMLAVAGLYLLKPRRSHIEFSSLWLWEGAAREERVHSLWQWLRRHLLLILQLLTALLGALILARPAVATLLPTSGQAVLLIDASASMLTRDGQPTRLDDARAQASQLLAQLPKTHRVAVVQLTDRAEVLADLSLDRRAAQAALRRLRGALTGTNVAEGLAAAAGVLRGRSGGDIFFFTDGAYATGSLKPPPGVRIQVIPAGQGRSDNQTVEVVEARRDDEGSIEAYVRVRNYSDQPVTQVLRILADGEVLEGQEVSLEPDEVREWLLRGFPDATQLIEARLQPRDLLAVDNSAVAQVDEAQPRRRLLLVNPGSDYLERALRALPGLEVTTVEAEDYDPTTAYDLYVFDGWMPPAPPAGHWLLVDPPANQAMVPVIGALGGGGPLPSAPGSATAGTLQAPSIVYTQPSPLLRYVDFSGVQIYLAQHLARPPWAEVVAASSEGPLILTGYPEGYRAVVFAFDLNPMSTNLVNRSVFPVLMANTLDWLSGLTHTATSKIVSGEALLIDPLPRATQVEILTPSGRTYTFAGRQRFRFVDTIRPGAYVVTQFTGEVPIAYETLIVGGIPSNESDIRPRADVVELANASSAVTVGALPPEPVDREWWRWLALGVLGVLLIEWWWFHRA